MAQYQPQGYGQQQNGFQQQYAQGQPGQDQSGALNSQMAGMSIGADAQTGSVRASKKKGRHAYHDVNQANQFQASAPPPPVAAGMGASPQPGFGGQQWNQQGGPAAGQYGGPQQMPGQQPPARSNTPLQGSTITSAQGKVDPEQVPSVPWSRDAPTQYYLENVYPTMEQHLPPPAAIPYVAVDQANSSPKHCRLTMNNIPASSEALNSTSLPLGLILQPLAAKQDGEQGIPVIDFGETGPPRCRRCRAYINPFMPFRSGGNKFVCNMCTFPNDVPGEYYSPLEPSGARVDRMQRPELMLGTVEFTAPKEYWTKEPVPQRWLFLLDASMEAVSKGFLESMCQGILHALYGTSNLEEEEKPSSMPGEIAEGTRVGFATFDREVHFYGLTKDRAEMTVMPDLEEPFVPISGGLFEDPHACRTAITNLLNALPRMFARIKKPEPALLPALNSSLEALKDTGGRLICSLASLPTWGPGRLFMRDKPELRDTDAEREVFKTEHPGFLKVAKAFTEHGIGADFFLAAPQGGFLDIATIGHVAEKTGGETYYYPNFQHPRENVKIQKELGHSLRREQGFQALLKVRCSNGLQVSGYYGNFTQHTFGADIELGAIDADKAFGVSFSYDGKLDSKLDAHFQSALLYTTATGERRIRCTNTVASISEGALDSMKLVDQDAIVTLFAKQAAMQMQDKQLKDIRGRLQERTIDVLAGYRKNFSGSHPPGQLVLPEHLKEFAMFMLGLQKSRAFKAGAEPTDRRVHDMRLIRGASPADLSLYLYPRIVALHALDEADAFPNERGHLRLPPGVRASFSRIDAGGAYLLDNGPSGPLILWLHSQVNPNLLEDLFGPGASSFAELDAGRAALPVLETHLNAQARNIVQFIEDTRGSRGASIQLARQGVDGAEYEFARMLVEDRNGEAMSYVDWLVHVHRHIQLEVRCCAVLGFKSKMTNRVPAPGPAQEGRLEREHPQHALGPQEPAVVTDAVSDTVTNVKSICILDMIFHIFPCCGVAAAASSSSDAVRECRFSARLERRSSSCTMYPSASVMQSLVRALSHQQLQTLTRQAAPRRRPP